MHQGQLHQAIQAIRPERPRNSFRGPAWIPIVAGLAVSPADQLILVIHVSHRDRSANDISQYSGYGIHGCIGYRMTGLKSLPGYRKHWFITFAGVHKKAAEEDLGKCGRDLFTKQTQ